MNDKKFSIYVINLDDTEKFEKIKVKDGYYYKPKNKKLVTVK